MIDIPNDDSRLFSKLSPVVSGGLKGLDLEVEPQVLSELVNAESGLFADSND